MEAGLAAGAAAWLPRVAVAADNVIATSYPGIFEEAYRAVSVPAFKERTKADVTLTPLLAIDQVAKITAARANPPYDVVIFDEGPMLKALPSDVLDKYPAEKSKSLKELPEAFQGHNYGGYGPTVTLQIIVIAYNPKKVAKKPTSWNDLWRADLKGRVGLTGMQSSLGTAYMCEIAKLHGGSEKDFEPAFRKVKDLLPGVAAIAPSPGALASLFQTGEIDIAPNYFNSVMTLKEKGLDVDYAIPESKSVIIRTSMHVVKNSKVKDLAAAYIDTCIDAQVQQKLLDRPFYLTPTNKNVKIAGEFTKVASSVDDLLKKSTLLDWVEINKTRPQLIERFNKEVKI
jgi:putative spermidine/putrescine transport system substrate-binding protein